MATETRHQELAAAADWAKVVLNRVGGAGGIVDQIAEGGWDGDLTEAAARDLADTLRAVAEHARGSRALAGGVAHNGEMRQHGGNAFRELLARRLPLNRKERYYTGTVLPMIVGSDHLLHLPRFLRRCGLDIDLTAELDHGSDGEQPIEFFTEYSFAESLFTDADKARFPGAPTDADTPDAVIVGADWLLAVEAKMFHNPTAAALNRQVRRQRVILDYLARTLRLPADRVAHVLLLPEKLAPASALDAPVVTWEQVLGDYEAVAPAYWLGVLREALDRYEDLVSRRSAFGVNADAKMTGADIVAAHAEGTLEFTYMGRAEGIDGEPLRCDIDSGAWRTRQYEVRVEPLEQKNWFPIPKFIELTAAH